MDSQEFVRWKIWEKIRGVFGETRGDLRNGMLCALLINLMTAMNGKTGKAKPSDFMPFFEKEKPKPATVEQTKQQIEVLQQVFGVAEG